MPRLGSTKTGISSEAHQVISAVPNIGGTLLPSDNFQSEEKCDRAAVINRQCRKLIVRKEDQINLIEIGGCGKDGSAYSLYLHYQQETHSRTVQKGGEEEKKGMKIEVEEEKY